MFFFANWIFQIMFANLRLFLFTISIFYHFYLLFIFHFILFYFIKQMASLYKSMFVRILICLEISLCLTSIMAMDLSTKRFCGHVLTESLALICDGEYETIVPSNSKRSGMQIWSQIAVNRECNESENESE